MSIDLIAVTHVMKTSRTSKKRVNFRGVNMHIDDGQRVALLGRKGPGLQEVLNLICGAVYPARGTVVRSSEVSWPIGESSFLSKDVSLAANMRFLARIYEVDEDQYAKRVGEVAQIEEHWNEKFGVCSKEVRSRFAFGIGVCLPFDIYLFESVELSDRDYQETSDEIVAHLGNQSGIVVTTTKGEIALQFCDRGYVLDGDTITYYEDIAEAVAHLERLEEGPGAELEEDVVEDERDEDFDVI